TLGLTVNAGVQLLLSPGDPLTLLQREVDARLRAVEHTLRELAGAGDLAPAPAVSLRALATAGMSRQLALLKSAALTNARARERHETLATTITLVDRLVTDAGALRMFAPPSSPSIRELLMHAADTCARTRRACAGGRGPGRGKSAAPPPSDVPPSTPAPRVDTGRPLEQLAMTGRGGAPPAAKESGPRLLVPDATTNPEYVQFAIK